MIDIIVDVNNSIGLWADLEMFAERSEFSPSSKRLVRLWQLGDIDQKLRPTEQAIDKLAYLLQEYPRELIWGPDIKVSTYRINNNLLPELYKSIPEGTKVIDYCKDYDGPQNIRVWKLGSIEKRQFPSMEVINKLIDVFCSVDVKCVEV